MIKVGIWNGKTCLFSFCRDLNEQVFLSNQVDLLQTQLEKALQYTFAFQLGLATVEKGKVMVQHLSPSASRVLGYPVDDFLTKRQHWLDSIYEEDRTAIQENLNGRIIGRESGMLEYRIINQDGSPRWVQDVLESRKILAGRVYLECMIKTFPSANSRKKPSSTPKNNCCNGSMNSNSATVKSRC